MPHEYLMMFIWESGREIQYMSVWMRVWVSAECVAYAYACMWLWLFLCQCHTHYFQYTIYECKSAVIQEKATLNEATQSADVPIVDCGFCIYRARVCVSMCAHLLLLVHTQTNSKRNKRKKKWFGNKSEHVKIFYSHFCANCELLRHTTIKWKCFQNLCV